MAQPTPEKILAIIDDHDRAQKKQRNKNVFWSEVDIQQVINKLNLRPRKCLGWKTPYEVYFKKSLHLV
nr:hypothetical protein [Escherichia coli]